jgi:hypothetical protein
VSLDPNIVKLLLEQIAESKKELNEAYKRKQDLIQLHDQLRDTVYANWDEEKFDKTNRDTWPPELRDSDVVLDLLDNLNEGVGYCHMLVIKHRYPDLHPVPAPSQQSQTPMPMLSSNQGQPGYPSIVLQQGQPPIQQNVSKGFWSGWHDRSIERMRMESQLKAYELSLLGRKETEVTSPNPGTLDPLDVSGNRLIGALNAVKQFITDCYLCWPDRKNVYFATHTHEKFRSRIHRLLGVIESFFYAAMNLEIEEIRREISNQMHLYTAILQAQAGTPVTIQEFNRPFTQDGLSSDNFESYGKEKMKLGAPPVQKQLQSQVSMTEGEGEVLDLTPNSEDFSPEEQASDDPMKLEKPEALESDAPDAETEAELAEGEEELGQILGDDDDDEAPTDP